MQLDKDPHRLDLIGHSSNPRSQNWHWVLPSALFGLNFLYSFAIISVGTDLFEHIVTIAYVVGLIAIFIFGARVLLSEDLNGGGSNWKYLSRSLVLGGIAAHVGLLVGFAVANAPDSVLWVGDSYSTHLPGAKNVAAALHGEEELRDTRGGWDTIHFAHYYVGAFFAVFGVKPWVSSLALLFAKTGTFFLILVLGKRLFSSTTALLALLTYILMPTIAFYTTTFYKEALVQFFVAFSFWGLYLLIVEKKYHGMMVLAVGLAMLMIERFYLFPPFALVLFISIWVTNRSDHRALRPLLFLLTVVSVAAFYFIYQERLQLSSLMPELRAARESYNAYSDIDRRFNIDLIYPLSVVKILLTPFFTIRKFSLYGDFSFLLLWGTFLNHVVILGALWTLVRNFKTNISRHWFLWIPFFYFILLFAYLAPFSGRQRDSFYPLLVIYFAALVVETKGFQSLRQFVKSKVRGREL